MALNVGRWFKYAQAKLDAAVSSGNRELDELEAEREAQLAERPWLASDGAAPSFDEAKARIAWEAEQAARRSDAEADPPAATPASAHAPTSTPESGDDAEAAQARIEIDRRARQSAERLDAIRRELGVEPPDDA